MIFSLTNMYMGIMKFLIYKILHRKRILFRKIPKININANFNISRDARVKLDGHIRIRNNVSFVCLDKGLLNIGKNCFFNDNCIISCRKSVTIGDNCIFGNNVYIYDNDHDYKGDISKYNNESVSIGDGTWCGCNVIILKGSHIGKNCVIAAGTTIKENIPDNSIVYTNKENIIKKIEKRGDVNAKIENII